MANNNDGTGSAIIGCGFLLLLTIVIPMLIDLIKTLIPFAIVGVIGYLIFLAQRYDNRTGDISRFLKRVLTPNPKRNEEKVIELRQQNEIYGLPQPKKNVLKKLQKVRKKLKKIELEKEELKLRQQQKVDQAIRHYASKIDKNNKEALLQNIFGDEPSGYAQSDNFERLEFEEQKKKKEEKLEMRELKQEVKEQLFIREKEALEIRVEAKEDRTNIRMEMKDGFIRVDEILMQLENKVITMKSYFEEKASKLEILIQKEVSNVNTKISNLQIEVEKRFSNVNSELADVKVSFGKEILRLDKAQMQIVHKLGEYETKLKKFAAEAMKIKNQAERFQIRGQRVLEQAQILYQKQQVQMKRASDNLDVGLEKIALHESGFALRVGKAKLQLDKISQDQYLELKNIGYAELGVKILRDDYTKREEVKQLEMKNLIADKQRAEERIREQQSKGQETAHLRHRIQMLDEKHQHASHTNSIMQKEFNVFRRLSKG